MTHMLKDITTFLFNWFIEEGQIILIICISYLRQSQSSTLLFSTDRITVRVLYEYIQNWDLHTEQCDI